MKIKPFGISLVVAGILSLGLNGCIGTDDTEIKGGSNLTTVTWNDTDSEFIINTKINNLTDFYHVRHTIIDSDGRNKLKEGANYTGTVTTTCTKQSSSGTYVEYRCITHRNTKSPIGDPSDQTNIIKLYDSIGYKVFMEEKSLALDRDTEISSSLQP